LCDEGGRDGWRKMRKEKMQGVAASEKESLTYDNTFTINNDINDLSCFIRLEETLIRNNILFHLI
jgi:hypothetical protein